MADFCKDCSIEIYGEDTKDLADIAEPGSVAYVLCEGCGWILVDENGVRTNMVTLDFTKDND